MGDASSRAELEQAAHTSCAADAVTNARQSAAAASVDGGRSGGGAESVFGGGSGNGVGDAAFGASSFANPSGGPHSPSAQPVNTLVMANASGYGGMPSSASNGNASGSGNGSGGGANGAKAQPGAGSMSAAMPWTYDYMLFILPRQYTGWSFTEVGFKPNQAQLRVGPSGSGGLKCCTPMDVILHTSHCSGGGCIAQLPACTSGNHM